MEKKRIEEEKKEEGTPKKQKKEEKKTATKRKKEAVEAEEEKEAEKLKQAEKKESTKPASSMVRNLLPREHDTSQGLLLGTSTVAMGVLTKLQRRRRRRRGASRGRLSRDQVVPLCWLLQRLVPRRYRLAGGVCSSFTCSLLL